jgi:hypothetical protein
MNPASLLYSRHPLPATRRHHPKIRKERTHQRLSEKFQPDEIAPAVLLLLGKIFRQRIFSLSKEKLQKLKISETNYTAAVRPQIVVEVAYNEIQRSPHYQSKFALRLARIKRIRPDKAPEQVDTIERLRQMYDLQFERKGELDR